MRMVTKSWQSAFAVYLQPAVLSIVLLGFASGLPYVIVFSTLSAWLTEAGIERSVIGFFSWIGITYSLKVFWSMVVDRLRLPLLGRLLGKRRSWMLVSQSGAILGLLGLSVLNPQHQLELVALVSIWMAFCSATQDVAIDAYRIEILSTEYQGAMAAAYVTGYRISLLIGAAGSLFIAEEFDWSIAYLCMAGIMLVGILTILAIDEPEHQPNQRAEIIETEVEQFLGVEKRGTFWQRLIAGFSDVVLSPFVEFFRRNGTLALLILLLISSYKMSDITLNVMVNPFFLDMGYTKAEIAKMTKLFGFIMAIAGAATGGVLVARFGILRPLLAGSLAAALTNLLYLVLAMSTPNLTWLATIVSVDNYCSGMATSVLIAYLSSLTSTAYTATQYALFSSLMILPAQMLGGFSGMIVEHFGYPLFFTYTMVTGLPAVILVFWMLRFHPIPQNGNP